MTLAPVTNDQQVIDLFEFLLNDAWAYCGKYLAERQKRIKCLQYLVTLHAKGGFCDNYWVDLQNPYQKTCESEEECQDLELLDWTRYEEVGWSDVFGGT